MKKENEQFSEVFILTVIFVICLTLFLVGIGQGELSAEQSLESLILTKDSVFF